MSEMVPMVVPLSMRVICVRGSFVFLSNTCPMMFASVFLSDMGDVTVAVAFRMQHKPMRIDKILFMFFCLVYVHRMYLRCTRWSLRLEYRVCRKENKLRAYNSLFVGIIHRLAITRMSERLQHDTLASICREYRRISIKEEKSWGQAHAGGARKDNIPKVSVAGTVGKTVVYSICNKVSLLNTQSGFIPESVAVVWHNISNSWYSLVVCWCCASLLKG